MPRQDLLSAIAAADKATASNRLGKPILQNVRIGDGLVTGTDLELRIDVAIAEHCEPFLVPSSRLLAILRSSNSEMVTLTAGKTTVAVGCGRGSWTLPTEDPLEYPTWEPADMAAVARLPADQFARAAKATVYATDNESSRYALGGVLLEVKGGDPTFVASDGRRMAIVETETDQAVDDRQVIVPAKLMALASGMAGGDGSVQIEANSREVRFELDGVTITGLLVEGRFPKWREVAGDPDGDAATMDVKELLGAVRSAAIVTSEQSKGVQLDWTSDTLVLSGRSSEYGESSVQCPVLAAGTCSKTKLDPRFVEDFLRHLPDDEEPHVDLYAKNPTDRVLLKCGPYTGVIMPLSEDA